MGTGAMSGEAQAMSLEIPESSSDPIDSGSPQVENARNDAEPDSGQVVTAQGESALVAGEAGVEVGAIGEDDDVTVVVQRGFPRLSREHKQTVLRVLAMFGVAAIGFLATGIVKLVLLHSEAPSEDTMADEPAASVVAADTGAAPKPRAGGIRVSAAPARAEVPNAVERVARPAVRRPTIESLGEGKPSGESSTSRVPQNDSALRSHTSLCQSALAKRDRAAISHVCALALETDASVAASIVAWAKRELDRGDVQMAATWARRALDADDRLAEAYLIVGVAEQDAKRAAAARAAYRRYLELAPKGRYAHEVRSSMTAL